MFIECNLPFLVCWWGHDKKKTFNGRNRNVDTEYVVNLETGNTLNISYFVQEN